MAGFDWMRSDPYDVIVVGGGPVGLYAGFKGALLHLRVLVVDKGRKWGRGFHVPNYHNIPTHLVGISGKEVINKLRRNIAQQEEHVSIEDFVEIRDIHREGGPFKMTGIYHPTGAEREYFSRAVVVATGVVDEQPIIGGDIKNIFPHANMGLICYCEICDGFLTEGKDVAILGSGPMAAQLALDIFHFNAKKATILTHGKAFKVSDSDLRRLAAKDVGVFEEEIDSVFGADQGFFGVRLKGGGEIRFDLAFSALGIYHINNELAIMMGGKVDEKGYILVDDNCRVLDGNDEPIPGLYAVGDVNYNWNQIMIGFGDADRAMIHAWSEYL